MCADRSPGRHLSPGFGAGWLPPGCVSFWAVRGCIRSFGGMGFNNPGVPWQQLRRTRSDANPGEDPREWWVPPPEGANGGDSPAWSHHRAPDVRPPELERRTSATRMPSCTATRASASSTAPASGGPRRGGRPSRARGLGAHRPRRALRGGALRRGRPRLSSDGRDTQGSSDGSHNQCPRTRRSRAPSLMTHASRASSVARSVTTQL
jgi:hypothetical protein